MKFHFEILSTGHRLQQGTHKKSLSSSNYTWKEEWPSIPVWEEIGYVFPQRIIQGSKSPSGDRCLLAVLSRVWEPQKEANLRSCHVSAASPRSPLPSSIGFPWNPALPDARLDALGTLQRHCYGVCYLVETGFQHSGCLMKSCFIINSHPFQHEAPRSVWVCTGSVKLSCSLLFWTKLLFPCQSDLTLLKALLSL